MNKRQTTIVSIFVLFAALLTLCGCKDNEKEIIDLARSNIENELKQEQESGRLQDYTIESCEVLSADEEQQKKVHIIYDVILGDADCTGMIVTVESLCTFEKNEKGEYAENAGMREYVKITAHEEEQYCRAVTTGGFVVKINKSETEGKSPEEVALILFRQWMERFENWNEKNSFIVLQHTTHKVSLQSYDADPAWGQHEGATGPRRKYPDAKGGWMAFPECEYTFYGYAAVIDSDFGQFGGKPFGNDGSTVSAEASFYGISNRMVMSEWDDCWTLETDAHFLQSLETSTEGSFRG